MKNDSIDLSIALDILNRAISELNIKIVNGDNLEATKNELEKYLQLKEDILKGNTLLIEKVVNGEI